MPKGKKKGKGRRRYFKKTKVSRGSKHSLAVEGGAAISLFKIATDKVATGASPIDAMKVKGRPLDDKLMDAANRAGVNALAWDNAKYALAGMAMHWAKNKPIAKIILAPADKLVKTIAGKRYGL